MLINCPRCGFSQPKDQYCAQCGVDMQAFKPKSAPLLTKIFQSTKTHVLVLVIAAAFVGQYVIRSEEPQRWVQKITRSQGATKTKSKFDESSTQVSGVSEAASERSTGEQLGSLRNQEIAVHANVEQPIQTGSQPVTGTPDTTNKGVLVGTDNNTNDPVFRIYYAEVPISLLNRWIADSSSAGFYQNLQEYSAGILPDYQRKTDSSVRVLEASGKKLSAGQTDSIYAGTSTADLTQVTGLSTSIEFRSREGNGVHGTLMVSRVHQQRRENFPAEFDLPKGAAFFIVGVLRQHSFGNDQSSLIMPPFQIFKSPDFAARKTEFVIIVEAEYR